jgi:hypothetical protein
MKTLSFLTILCLFFAITSCSTTIPVRDTVLPKFVFKITGDGINETINQDFDFDNKVLYLRRGALYTVALSVTDQGGLKMASWELPYSAIIRLNNPVGWPIANSGNPYMDKYEFTGYRESPVNGAVTNSIRIEAIGGPLSGDVVNYEFIFSGRDFHNNSIQKTLIVRITNEASRIGPRD